MSILNKASITPTKRETARKRTRDEVDEFELNKRPFTIRVRGPTEGVHAAC